MQSDTQQICFLVIKDQVNLSIKCATSHQKDIDQIKSADMSTDLRWPKFGIRILAMVAAIQRL